MKTIVDIHNHLDLLPGPINAFTSQVYRQKNNPNYLIGHARQYDFKLIISVALYLTPLPGDPLKQVQRQIDKLKRFSSYNPDVKFIQHADDLDSNFRMGLILHLESARWMKGDLELLRALHSKGVKAIIPVHFLSNWFGAAGEDPRTHHQLSDSGKRFLDEMQRLGMWLDVSHMSDVTTEQALQHFQGHCIAGHVGLQKFQPPKRNISEQNARLLFSKNGYYGLIAWSHLMGNRQIDFKNQIDFLLQQGFGKQLILGTDLGAPIMTPKFIKSIFDYVQFIKQNYPDQAEDIICENALRFLRRAL